MLVGGVGLLSEATGVPERKPGIVPLKYDFGFPGVCLTAPVGGGAAAARRLVLPGGREFGSLVCDRGHEHVAPATVAPPPE